MLAARLSRLSLVVHAVEGDARAACGARPARGHHWRLSTRLPVTCPTCLMELQSDRLALVGVASAVRREPLHVRRIGREGFKPRRGGIGLTLCGRSAGWDVEVVETRRRLAEGDVCTRCRNALAGAPKVLDTSNAVR